MKNQQKTRQQAGGVNAGGTHAGGITSNKTEKVSLNAISRQSMMAGAALVMSNIGFVAHSVEAQVSLPQAPQTIESQQLRSSAFETGTLRPGDGALSETLWQGSDPARLGFLMDQLPARPYLPVVGQTMRQLLLTPARLEGANGAGVSQSQRDDLGGRKLLSLVKAGFIDEARTIASLSDAPRNDPNTGMALAFADLLTKRENDACARGASLPANRDDAFWVKLRTFCYAMAGERDAADLTFGLLRDRGLLSIRDEEFLGAAVIGVAPNKPMRPRTALELAVVRFLNAPVAPDLGQDAEGGVIKAIVLDSDLDAVSRIHAARVGLAMGVVSAREYGQLLAGITVDPALAGNAEGMLEQQPKNPMTQAIVYQSVQRMNAPEFLRDKAALIARALEASRASSESFVEMYAVNRLYADDVTALEGALIQPAHAARFAMARMAAGDSKSAGRWLFAMRGDGTLSDLGDDLTDEFMEVTGYLSLLDPQMAQAVADSAGISLIGLRDEYSALAADQNYTENQRATTSVDKNGDDVLQVVEAIFDSAIGTRLDVNDKRPSRLGPRVNSTADQSLKQGQAALAALAISNKRNPSPVETVIRNQALRIAGLGAVQNRLLFEQAWQNKTGHASGPVPYNSPQAQSQTRSDDGLTPSLKPKRP